MLLFVMPAPIALLFVIPTICAGVYFLLYIKQNKFKSNKLEKIERQIIKINKIVLIYLVIMFVFRNNHNGNFMALIGFLGSNIMLTLLYISIIAAYLILRELKVRTNENTIVDVSLNNHKRGFYYLIAATIIARFSVTAYLSFSSTVGVRIVIIFILLCLSRYEMNKNSKVVNSQESKYPENI